MERLFELLKTYRDDIFDYRFQELFDESIVIFNSEVKHIKDDLVRFIQEWDNIITECSERKTIEGRIRQYLLPVGLSLKTFAYAYALSQSPEEYKPFVKDYLANDLDIDTVDVDEGPANYFNKEKLEKKCEKLAEDSELPPAELKNLGELIETMYDKFFEIYGKDLQKLKPAEKENTELCVRVCRGEITTVEEFDRELAILERKYGGEERLDSINLAYYVMFLTERSTNIICDVLKSQN